MSDFKGLSNKGLPYRGRRTNPSGQYHWTKKAGRLPRKQEQQAELLYNPADFGEIVLGYKFYPKQRTALEACMEEGCCVSIAAANGAGKALALDTPIATLSGWKTMGQILEGDYVFGVDGNPYRVTLATPAMFGRKCYRVVFSDGSSIVADEDHLWNTTFTVPDRRGRIFTRNEITSTTESISKNLRYGNDKWGGLAHSIEITAPLHYPAKDLIIPPYSFGVWLGDGHSKASVITFSEPDRKIIEEVKRDGFQIRERKDPRSNAIYAIIDFFNKATATHCRFGHEKAKYWSTNRKGAQICNACQRDAFSKIRTRNRLERFTSKLKKLGVYSNKHIPRQYLESSLEQRESLLQGLMDTDGYCSRRGSCEFTTTTPRLADDFLELAIGLGYKATMSTGVATINGKNCGLKYRVRFKAEPFQKIFRLERKQNRITPSKGMQRFRNPRRFVESVNAVESVPVKCIEVNSPDHCYLAGKNLIKTHNTSRILPTLVLWHQFLFPAGKVKVTSGSYTQIEDQIWPAIKAHKDRFKNWVWYETPNITTIHPRTGERGFFRGFTTNEPGRAEGDHPDKMNDPIIPGSQVVPLMFIVDEAKTSPPWLRGVLEGRVRPTRLILMSSHGFAEGWFYESQTILDKFIKITINADDCPHITQEEKDGVRRDWAGYPEFADSILGFNFLPLVQDAVLNGKALDDCLANPPAFRKGDRHLFFDFGWSLAGGETVAAIRNGNKIELEECFHCDHLKSTIKDPSPGIVERVIAICQRLGASAADTGWISGDECGGGKLVMDALDAEGWFFNRVNSGFTAFDSEHYGNVAAESWYEFGKQISQKLWILPTDRTLRGQLLNRKRTLNKKGKLAIEDKAEMKARGVPSPDRADACWIRGTKVLTATGLMPIEQIGVGDEIVTPMGNSKVVYTHCVESDELVRVVLPSGRKLIGTPKHKVFVQGQGWVRMDALLLANNLESVYGLPAWKLLNSLFTRVVNTGFKALVDIIKTDDTMRRRDFFTGASGLTYMDLFLKACASIIRTKIGRIIPKAISNSRAIRSIAAGIRESYSKTRVTLSRLWQDLKKQELLPSLGTNPKLEAIGIGNMESKPCRNDSLHWETRFARIAEKSFQKGHLDITYSAQQPVETGPPERVNRSLKSASFADLISAITSTARPSIAPMSVRAFRLRRPVKVYNLTLAEENVYYAEGVLVQNCIGASAPTGGHGYRNIDFCIPVKRGDFTTQEEAVKAMESEQKCYD